MSAAIDKKHVLIIDDENEFFTLFKFQLEAEGYSVTYSPGGQEALDLAKTLKPGLIILDLMMPDMSGFDILEKLHDIPEVNDSYKLMYSALTKPGEIERAKSLGADEFIVKSNTPFSEVMQHIRTILGTL